MYTFLNKGDLESRPPRVARVDVRTCIAGGFLQLTVHAKSLCGCRLLFSVLTFPVTRVRC
jgi:hypothetical protein